MTVATIDIGAVVLCGGASRRMGRPKAWLDFDGEPLLARVVRRLGEAASPIVVVAAPDQALPPLPAVEIVRDPVSGRGPLQGIATGLAALAARGVEVAFVASTDAPFLHAALVRRLAALRVSADPPYDAVVPAAGGHNHPLAAVYRTALHADAAALIAENRPRPFFLLERARTLFAPADLLLGEPGGADLRAVDPNLDCFRNLNTPEEYEAALREIAGHAPNRR